MKNNKLISLVLALLVCFSLILTVSATTDKDLTLAVEANASPVVSGDTIKVLVKVSRNPGFLALNFAVNWDSNYFEYVDKNESVSKYSSYGLSVVPQTSKAIITIADLYMAARYPDRVDKIMETGNIVELTLKVKDNATGSAKISFSDLNFGTLTGDFIVDITEITAEPLNLNSNSCKHTSVKSATCTTPEVCNDCNQELKPALGHTAGAAATCTTAQTCTVCSVEIAPAKGHTPGAVSCTAAQLCKVCNVELAPAKGHDSKVELAAKAATCTSTGLTAGKKCSACGEIMVAQESVPAIGHNWSDAWANSNSSGHWHVCKNGCSEKKDFAAHTLTDGICSVCGYGCKHSGGTATCTELATCGTCGKPYGELLAHTPNGEATCNSDQVCTVCNAVIAEKLAHQLTTVEAQAATCGAAGWDAYEKCSNCDYTTYKEIPATENHAFSEWTVVIAATSNTVGEQVRTCSVCGVEEVQVIPALGSTTPTVPVLWIVILAVLVVAVIIVFILIKKRKN